VLVPAAVAVIALIPPGLVKPGNGVIWEGESSYQFIQVQRIADHGRVLHLNEGWAEHSVWYPKRVLTGGDWDQFLLAPLLHGRGLHSLAMIGYAGGTVGRQYGVFWPEVKVLGIELDPTVTAIGRRYFGLDSNPNVTVATADGRPVGALETQETLLEAVLARPRARHGFDRGSANRLGRCHRGRC